MDKKSKINESPALSNCPRGTNRNPQEKHGVRYFIITFSRSHAPSLAVIHKCKRPVIPAWMPESSHKDVNPGAGNLAKSSTCASGKLPSMALDSGIHAGMTAFLGRRDLCITMSAPSWACLPRCSLSA